MRYNAFDQHRMDEESGLAVDRAQRRARLTGKVLRRLYNKEDDYHATCEPVRVLEENGSLVYVENERTGERDYCGREEVF